MLTILSRTWMLDSRSGQNNMSEERGIQYQYNISEWIGYSKVLLKVNTSEIKWMCASSLFPNAQLMVDGNCWFLCVLVGTASIPHISKKLGAQGSGDESKSIPQTSL